MTLKCLSEPRRVLVADGDIKHGPRSGSPGKIHAYGRTNTWEQNISLCGYRLVDELEYEDIDDFVNPYNADIFCLHCTRKVVKALDME